MVACFFYLINKPIIRIPSIEWNDIDGNTRGTYLRSDECTTYLHICVSTTYVYIILFLVELDYFYAEFITGSNLDPSLSLLKSVFAGICISEILPFMRTTKRRRRWKRETWERSCKCFGSALKKKKKEKMYLTGNFLSRSDLLFSRPQRFGGSNLDNNTHVTVIPTLVSTSWSLEEGQYNSLLSVWL